MKIFVGWTIEHNNNGVTYMRYYPEPTVDAGHFALSIHITTKEKRLRMYSSIESSDAITKVLVPDTIKSDEELKSWAIAIWRMR